MPRTHVSLELVLAREHPLASYRASLGVDVTHDRRLQVPQSSEDVLASFHQLQARAHTWMSLAGTVAESTDKVLASLNDAIHPVATAGEGADDGAAQTSETTAISKIMEVITQHSEAALKSVPGYAKLRGGIQPQCGHTPRQPADFPPLPLYYSALRPPPTPAAGAIDDRLRGLTALERELLIPGPPPATAASGPREPALSQASAPSTLTVPYELRDSGESVDDSAPAGGNGTAEATRLPAVDSFAEPHHRDQAEMDRGFDLLRGVDGSTAQTPPDRHFVLTRMSDADDGAMTQPSATPLFADDWAVPPPPVILRSGGLTNRHGRSHSSASSEDSEEALVRGGLFGEAATPPAVVVTPQADAAMAFEPTEFSTFADARLRDANANVMLDALSPAVRYGQSWPLPSSSGLGTVGAQDGVAETAKVPSFLQTAHSTAASAAVQADAVQDLEARLRERVRDLLVAEASYSQGVKDTASAAASAMHAEITAFATRDGDAMERLQVMLLEAESLLDTVQDVQLHSWREALAGAASDPTQVITSPRFALCCSGCRTVFTKTVVRTTCRRCGQFYCPDCVSDYGIGPDVRCTDEQGGTRYVSLGWEPVCGVCYRHCASYALSVLQHSQPLLLTDASTHTDDASSTPPVQTPLRAGSANGVPLKHLILSGSGASGALPSLSHSGETSGLAADGFPPFYVYVAGDRSLTMTDRVSYYCIKSTGRWKNVLKGTGTATGNLFTRIKMALGSYRHQPTAHA